MLERRIKETASRLCQAFGAKCTVNYKNCYPVLVNTATETDHAIAVASQLVGSDHVNPHHEPTMGSEDFAYMLERRPGCYIFIGNGDGDGAGESACMIHNAGYDFNDEVIETGVAYWCSLAESLLPV